MATKRQAIERKIRWNQALLDGRVVRYAGGQSFTAFNTPEDAQRAVDVAKHNGFQAELVTLSEADRYSALQCVARN